MLEAIEKGLPIFPIPGPVAFVSAAVCSGLDLSSLAYLGFVPAKQGQRLTKLQSYASLASTMVFYVSPHALRSTLADMAVAFGARRRVCIARELTKIHEEFFRGSLSDAVLEFTDREPKGEICVVVDGFSSSSLSTEEKISNAIQGLVIPGETTVEAEGGPLGLETQLLSTLMNRWAPLSCPNFKNLTSF